MSATFAELGLSAPLLRAVAELGYEEPTPIQQQAIGPLLAGRDLVGQAQTGTGKTAAFALPMLERLRAGVPQPQGLVLVPTRELAIQNAEAIHALGRYTGARVLPIYGGQSIERQLRVLQRGVDIVVGTPGRVLDHLRRGTLSLAAVRMAVLDEADEMLAMGFIEDVEAILEQVPTERQTALFSATIPPRLAELARRFLREPLWVSVVRDTLTVPQPRQVYYEMPTSAIIFTRTKRDAAELADQLIGLGYQAEPLHGDLSQAERDRTMRRFREGAVELLVATDVAARGLDIPEVSHVINYDVPADPEVYVHRIGRTGRAGRKGEAITLVTPRERRALHLIERLTKGKLKPARLPTAADVAARRREALKETLRTMVAAGDLEPYLLVVEELAAEHDVAEIAAAALKLTGELETRGNGAATPEPAPREVFPEDGLSAEPGMTKLFLSLGRADGLRPNDIVGAIANEAGLPGKAIGAIDLYDRFSLVQVPKKDAHRVLAALQRTTLRGRRVHAEIARPRRR